LIEGGRGPAGPRGCGCDAGLEPFLLGLGQAVCRSWQQGFAGPVPLPACPIAAAARQRRASAAEGYAFYALYPEAYAACRRRLRLAAPPRVIGIRSIGTSLAAIVARRSMPETFSTVRPEGDPFDRRISVSPPQEAALLQGEATFVIVDEGPWPVGQLVRRGRRLARGARVPLDRIAFLPSHAERPARRRVRRHRERWRRGSAPARDLGRSFRMRLADGRLSCWAGRRTARRAVRRGWRHHLLLASGLAGGHNRCGSGASS
jgi:hypothetical protein